MRSRMLTSSDPAPAISDVASRAGALHEIFEIQADARPQAVAVDCGGERTTYADLEGRANRLARHLLGRGVTRGSIVAMMLPRSIDAYAAILAILKSGAAYVPIDPEYPADRVACILEDSGARALVTTRALAGPHAVPGREVICVDADRDWIGAEPSARLEPGAAGAGPRDLCYIIYTSGSTGRPKGVMIEHRSAVHLVRAESRIYGVRPDDRVFQGASLAFDLSIEEIWLAFQAGATLVPATGAMLHAGPDLSRLLAERGVTVLSTVPTLLTILAEDIPTLRLLILGGEACPPHLVDLWSRRGRRIVNTYGPTETTVIATCAELAPGRPVTIGRAIPGYRVHLLDERLRPVPPGEAGEICIGGIGVARGYVNRPDETRARFVPDRLAADGVAPGEPVAARLYRTGDLGRLDARGDIEFLGRLDGQVKLRGFRVELQEIEAVLAEGEGVRAAACAVREDPPGVQQLVGYIVPKNGHVDETRLVAHLRTRLPAYMVPATIETIGELPRLPSGKLDRASLPPPRGRSARQEVAERENGGGRSRTDTDAARSRTSTERSIAEVWSALFRPHDVSLDDDFFLDLGGHSLLVAKMVSELRRDPRFASVSVIDVYEHPTIRKLASALDIASRRNGPPRASDPSAAWRAPARPGSGGAGPARHRLAGALQALGLYVVSGFHVLQSITPYLVFFLLLENGAPALQAAVWGVGCSLLVFPALVLVAVAAKWTLLGRIRPGRHPLWGWYYVRWWLVQALVASLPLDYLFGTPLLPFVYRLLGARIGKDVHLATDRFAAFDLVAIGDGASIDHDASLPGYTVEDQELVLGPTRVGARCFVGTRSMLSDGVVMEDGARLDDLSLLPRGARVPAGETWAGSPARPVRGPVKPVAPPPARSPLRRAASTALYAALVPVLPVLLLVAFVPGVSLLTRLDPFAQPLLYLAATPLVGASFVLLLTAEVVLLKWLLVGRVRAGTYPLHGGFYVRHWIVDQLLAMSLDHVGQLHATLYLAPWYRALGARLGRSVELSTASLTTPDLLDIGDECTIADEVSLGEPRVEGGWMTTAPTRLGRRVFIGNSGVVPSGLAVGDGSLIGVLSIAPGDPSAAARTGASWLGSPPILLPRRETSKAFSETKTFHPGRRLRLARAAFEILRVTLVPAGFIVVMAATVRTALGLRGTLGAGATLALLPIVYAAVCALVLGGVVLVKWALMGRFRPFVRPLWTPFIWRLELANALYEFLSTPLALDALQGTPFLPFYLRLLGARIGRQVYLHTTGFLEFDLVDVGDRAALNEDCVVQTHLFEDRVLKASGARIGADAVVGSCSVVLYDSEMEAGSSLDALSLLMKGERLPAGTAWTGLPAAARIEDEAPMDDAAA
ncbi:MAG TPA: Pls/PosA family non-ribosomal peptide synthetase [Candidatus Polarisedimenticolia bacterium]|nr:Pls/PosA family non-ribosomal peptide synthetase [Candidatus Polarisedimenticolia bacterium]